MVALTRSAGLTALLATSFVNSRHVNIARQDAETPYINATFSNVTQVGLDVSITNTTGRNATAPLLYGWMFEDINHSGDGGLYAEMIVNRAFQGSTSTIGTVAGYTGSNIQSSENPILPFGPVITGWRGVGDVKISLDMLHPLSDQLPIVLEIGKTSFGWEG